MQSITLPENIFFIVIEYGIFGEGSQISTKPEARRDSCFFASDWTKFETLPRKYRTLLGQAKTRSPERHNIMYDIEY